MLTMITETRAQFASKSHGTWMPKRWLMIPKSSFRRPAQTSRLEEARDRPGDDDRRAVEALKAQPVLVERDREEETERERTEER